MDENVAYAQVKRIDIALKPLLPILPMCDIWRVAYLAYADSYNIKNNKITQAHDLRTLIST